ncbi:hypothetical protein DL546_005325 [Coniochaeta pulveracea]|uniref:Altered inheritance of mitochondria protein 41 n=1 Tax=Coniochaeta pulveracea TaxID=177199 RepID=A0A420YD55_9PEZI|nr:hypothetical protein DL546_005325 [Coniochaeta pulveracea]
MAASRLPAAFLRNLSRPSPRSHIQAQLSLSSRCLALTRPYSSDEAPPPPLLVKLKGDLKTAMRAKDAPRLAVLRSVLATTLNASKTSSPIKTDVQLVNLLRKQARSQRETAEEFRSAKREDLAEKEEAQIKVLEEYANSSGIQTVAGEELRNIVEATMGDLAAEGVTGKSALGEAMKRLFAPGGPLEGKDVDKNEVSTTVRELAK